MDNGVRTVQVCFGTICTLTPGLDPDQYEVKYQRVYKPLISSLYNLHQLAFTLYLSGPLIEWMEHNHPEFFMILEEMLSRKQIDVLGGGYYDPLFPMIPPADRVGQIELLTTAIRKYFGKRPRGVWLTASAWEPSMISSLCTCGIEYVVLDRIMLSTSGFPGVDGLSPVILEDSGKTVIALPMDNHFRNLERFTPESFLDDVLDRKRGQDSVVTVFIDQISIPALFSSDDDANSWFGKFLGLLESRKGIELSTTGKMYRSKSVVRRAYISSGMSPYDHDDFDEPDDVRILARTSIKQYLLKTENAMRLYAKMMYVHALVNQLRGDKARKKNAREDIWRAQANEIFRFANSGNSSEARMLRTLAYKNLLIAEKMARVRGVFSPSIIPADFDMDTLKEYLCQLDKLNIYVHACGGKIFELDVFSVYRNYCDLCMPSSCGMFIDHFFDPEELELFSATDAMPETPVFASSVYQETSVDPVRQELQLKTSGTFGPFQQPLSLRKQYSFRNEGVQVQYILKNDSPLALSGIFLVELDMAFSKNRHKPSLMTVYAHEARQDSAIRRDSCQSIEWLQISDNGSGVKFTLEANESPSFIMKPVHCNEPCEGSEQAPEGACVYLYWKVELGPNFETEKTVFLNVES